MRDHFENGFWLTHGGTSRRVGFFTNSQSLVSFGFGSLVGVSRQSCESHFGPNSDLGHISSYLHMAFCNHTGACGGEVASVCDNTPQLLHICHFRSISMLVLLGYHHVTIHSVIPAYLARVCLTVIVVT